ncbi:THUMP domain-containing protein 1 isoform 2 [Hibiscus syriacus]|uniref:THUMP domain-containing protein 1 isoform 2 n=1 Tax=Hibiscus syriacus TaxID=106335 RepID=A0A6A2ZIZ1_HIBSY|nr:THUMP domain-containing protein 1 homolog [Hibiscus syriacus]XP_039014293.1 THUMP domain-containing protein 1 homolog [Hibiscus syriacus]KAE8691673.1 THUMP domain-containing protein 1 isoform 2 [Hibiscus syriacus]
MAAENKAKGNTVTAKGKKRKQYLPHNKAVKKKGAYPLRPGVQGFLITCDGGRERQAAHEAIYVIDSFFEDLVNGKDFGEEPAVLPNKPLNKKITFSYSDDEDIDEEEGDDEREEEGQEEVVKSDASRENDASQESLTNKDSDHPNSDDVCHGKIAEETNGTQKDGANIENQVDKSEDPPEKEQCLETDTSNQVDKLGEPSAKKQCLETDTSKSATSEKEKSIDKLIEAELNELGDKSKRLFFNLDSGCNGVVFVQMRKKDGVPGPKDIVQYMMTSAASTRKHMSRFILRVLPIEVACYSSEEEITRAMKPLIEQYFPVETQNPRKFAVLYEVRANSGIDRMKIINTVAKAVPAPHKVDLSNPDTTIIVEIVKTICLIGVVEKYKELAKYNLRQLTSPKQ